MTSPFRHLVVVLATLAIAPPLAVAQQAPLSAGLLQELRFREIGRAVTGGRIHDVEALPNDPSTIYVATASGGLWKTTNRGTTWTPIFDSQPVSTFGKVVVDPCGRDREGGGREEAGGGRGPGGRRARGQALGLHVPEGRLGPPH